MRKKSVKKISAIAGVIITLSLGLQQVCGGNILNTDPDVGSEKSFATGSVSAGSSKAVDGSDTVQKSTYSGSETIRRQCLIKVKSLTVTIRHQTRRLSLMMKMHIKKMTTAL